MVYLGTAWGTESTGLGHYYGGVCAYANPNTHGRLKGYGKNKFRAMVGNYSQLHVDTFFF